MQNNRINDVELNELKAMFKATRHKNYMLTDETRCVDGHILHRIKYFNGSLGGWIESINNLYSTAKVTGDAMVYGNSVVRGEAIISGNAIICDSDISGNAIVTCNAIVHNSVVTMFAIISGDANVQNSKILSNSRINGTVINSATDGHLIVNGVLIDSMVGHFPGYPSKISNGVVEEGQTYNNVYDFQPVPED